jgi:hypothetical protein
MPKLPPEIIDQIISSTDLETAIETKNDYAIKKFYDKNIHTWKWAAENGYYKIMKWLYKKYYLTNNIDECDEFYASYGYAYEYSFRNDDFYASYDYDYEYSFEYQYLHKYKQMNKIPLKLFNKIISYTDFQTAFIIKSSYGIKKLYNKQIHTMNWAAKNGNADIFKWIYKNCYYNDEIHEFETKSEEAESIAKANGHSGIVLILHGGGSAPVLYIQSTNLDIEDGGWL